MSVAKEGGRVRSILGNWQPTFAKSVNELCLFKVKYPEANLSSILGYKTYASLCPSQGPIGRVWFHRLVIHVSLVSRLEPLRDPDTSPSDYDSEKSLLHRPRLC